jgi:hypothetical protein
MMWDVVVMLLCTVLIILGGVNGFYSNGFQFQISVEIREMRSGLPS